MSTSLQTPLIPHPSAPTTPRPSLRAAPSPLSLVKCRSTIDSDGISDTDLDVVVAVSIDRCSDTVAYAVFVDGQAPIVSTPRSHTVTSDALFAAFADVVVKLPTDRTWRVGIAHTRFIGAYEPLAATWPHIELVTVPNSHPVMVFAQAAAGAVVAPFAQREDECRATYQPPRLVVATDGSSGNRGSKMRGGFGWIDEHGRFSSGVIASGEPLDAEVSAIIDLLHKTKPTQRLSVLIDSASAIAVADAAAKGEAHAPRRCLGLGLFSRLSVLLHGRDVEFVRVIGHDGHPLNEGADRLSRYARRAHDMSVCDEMVASKQAEIVAEEIAQWRMHQDLGSTAGTPRRQLVSVS